MVWVSDEHQGKVDAVINKCLEQLPSPQLRESFLTRLAEALLDGSDTPAGGSSQAKSKPARARTKLGS
jgi:hypothetical protein